MAVHKKYGKPMTDEVKAVLRRNGLRPSEYIVKQDLQHSVIVCNVITGEYKMLDK